MFPALSSSMINDANMQQKKWRPNLIASESYKVKKAINFIQDFNGNIDFKKTHVILSLADIKCIA